MRLSRAQCLVTTAAGKNAVMASYSVNPDAVAQAEHLIDSRQYVLDSDWGQVQPRASDQNAYLKQHSWDDYAPMASRD